MKTIGKAKKKKKRGRKTTSYKERSINTVNFLTPQVSRSFVTIIIPKRYNKPENFLMYLINFVWYQVSNSQHCTCQAGTIPLSYIPGPVNQKLK